MKDFFDINGYVQWVNHRDNTYSCTCPDFQYRKLKKEGTKTIAIGKCKHLLSLEPKPLTDKKKQLLRDFVDNICEVCGKEDLNLTPHRINRGYQGGRYVLRNIELICSNCHKIIHRGEFK